MRDVQEFIEGFSRESMEIWWNLATTYAKEGKNKHEISWDTNSIGHVPLVGIFGDMDIRDTLFEGLLRHKASVSSTKQQHVTVTVDLRPNKLINLGQVFFLPHPTGPLEQVCLTSFGQCMPKEGSFVAGFGIAKRQPQLRSALFFAHFAVYCTYWAYKNDGREPTVFLVERALASGTMHVTISGV